MTPERLKLILEKYRSEVESRMHSRPFRAFRGDYVRVNVLPPSEITSAPPSAEPESVPFDYLEYRLEDGYEFGRPMRRVVCEGIVVDQWSRVSGG
jgi:hypothetical protein